jgi:hypothetical protein
MEPAMRNDLADAAADAVVRRLNDQYIRALLASDARWFGDHLAADFVCIESDGRVSDRAAFIEMVRGPSELVDYLLMTKRLFTDGRGAAGVVQCS